MNRTQSYDGIVDMLKKLREQGVSIGVMSNKYDLAAKALVRHYFGDLVQLTLGERPGHSAQAGPGEHARADARAGRRAGDHALYRRQLDRYADRLNAGLTAIGVVGLRQSGGAGGDRCIRSGRGAGGADSDFRARSANVDALTRAFTSRGFAFSYFPTANEAARYIASACAGKSVSLGGSMTFQEMGLPEAFADSTEVTGTGSRRANITRRRIFISRARMR